MNRLAARAGSEKGGGLDLTAGTESVAEFTES